MKPKELKIGKGFGKRLRKLRKGAGLTQKELGEKTGVHPVSIEQYETGVRNPSEKTAEKIRAFFDEAAANIDKPAPAMPKKRGRPKKEPTDGEGQAPAKKRGRPKKEKAEAVLDPKIKHRLDNLGASLKTRTDAEKNADDMDMLAEARRAKGQERSKTPARLGMVEQDWLDQQIESHVRTYGFLITEGPVRIVIMQRRDLADLCRLMLKVGGVQVNGE